MKQGTSITNNKLQTTNSKKQITKYQQTHRHTETATTNSEPTKPQQQQAMTQTNCCLDPINVAMTTCVPMLLFLDN
eukprot:m.24563 g.24563  ORF g.24563 m.24563 type:complete len:76 (+) comp14652_c0_seq1:232-459(+)